MACPHCEYMRAQSALLIEKGLMVKARFAAIRSGGLKTFERDALPQHEERIAAARARVDQASASLKGGSDAKAATDVQAKPARRTTAREADSEPAGKAGAAHGQRGVEADPTARAPKGRVSVPRVRKAGGGKAVAR